MKCTLAVLLPISLLPGLAFGAEYLVGVGKYERTGKKGLGFDPSVIFPQPGDTIVWEFRSGQHSVVESSFAQPCVGSGGIDTGVFTVSDALDVDAPGLPRYTVTVNNTDPRWFFDQAGGLCNQGAVLAVNPSAQQTAAQFVENSGASEPAASSPSTPTTPSTAGSSPSSPSSGAAATSGSAAQNSPAPTETPTKSNGAERVGQAGGLVLGAVAALALAML
ncbi:hypothetical protein H0H81_003463 [Sphagnurus paluster]|uniref:Uncharacterized protein n=1 Tax=Sphagnurus paluster TaxID=117069 RepID=A0A9P7FRZ1_9AGAR|nr:hypothetical protein H0H81_003463 [Sphagnurus paluster]